MYRALPWPRWSPAVLRLIVILYLKFREKQLCLTLKKLVCMDSSYLRDYIRVSLPVLLNQAQWGAAQMVQTGSWAIWEAM